MKQNDQSIRDSCPSSSTGGLVGDNVQQSCVSSCESAQNILANGIIGPLILEALDGFLILLTRDGTIQFVSDNVANYLQHTASDLLGKSIYALIHSDDRHEFERCLSVPDDELQTSSNSPLSNRSSSFSCRVLVKSDENEVSEGRSCYEAMQMLTILQPYPCDTDKASLSLPDNQFFLACIARRTAVVSKSQMSKSIAQFDTKQDLHGKILVVDTGDKEDVSLQSLIGHNIQEFCHASDVAQMHKHYAEVMKIGSNLSGVYRFQMPQGHYAFVQTKSKLCRNESTAASEFVVSTHSVVRQCNEESELNGSASICLMKALISRSTASGLDEGAPLKDAVSDLLPAAVDEGCSVDLLPAVTARSIPETATTSRNCNEDVAKNESRLDSGSGSASNGLNMDDIIEYLQCQDASLLENTAQHVSSGNVSLSSNFTSDCNNPLLSMSDSMTSTLSLAALQQLASECSTIDLSSFGVDSNVPFVGSNGPASAAAATDIKQIDTEMQAILAELLMPGPQPAVEPQSSRQPFPVLPETAVTRGLADSLQPQILSQQLLQAPVASLQPVPASVTSLSSLQHTQPSFSTTGSQVSSTRSFSSSPQAVPLIEHLRRLKHNTPTGSLLAATLPVSTSAEPFQTSHDVGLKDLLLSNDEDIRSAKTGGAAEPEKLTQFIRQSTAMSPSPLAAVNGLSDARVFDVTNQHTRPAIILKQLLEDLSEPAASSPTASEPFDVSPKVSRCVIPDCQKNNGATYGSKQPLAMSELMFKYNSPVSVPSTSPLLLTPSNPVEPPFVQLITSVEDTVAMKQSSPTAPLTFSMSELTSVSHLWSPPSFTSQLNCIDQLPAALSLPQSQTSVAPVRSGAETSMSVASSQSLVTLTSSGGPKLKVTPPRMSASRNVLLRELLKPSASSSGPMPFKLLPKLVKTANGASMCSANFVSDTVTTLTSAATRTSPSVTASRKDAMPDAVPSKIPKFDKSSSSHSISDDTLTKHLTALWEREDSVVLVPSAAPVSRPGNKRKAASVSSYLSASKTDVSLPSANTGNQLSTSTILSQLLSSYTGATSPVDVAAVNSLASDSLQLSLQKNVLLMQQKERQNVAAAKQSSAVNASSSPLRRSSIESIPAASNIFRLPTYAQVIGNGAMLSSPSIKAKTVANDVFLCSPQVGSLSSVGNPVSSVVTDVVSSAAGGASSLLLNQSATDTGTIANQMLLDDNELLRQLEQILSEPGLSLADIDNVLGGCLVVPPSLPQSLSAADQKAVGLIQSQLMSMETSPSSAVANSVSPQWSNGTLCQQQQLSGKSALTSDTMLSTVKSETQSHGTLPSVDNQPLLATAAVNSSVSLHPGLQSSMSGTNSSQENIVAAIVQRAAAEAAARSSRQSSVDVARQQLPLPVSSVSQATSRAFEVQCANLGDLMNISFAPNISLQRASSQLTPSTSQALTVPQPVIRVASPLSSVIVSQSSLPSAAIQPVCARIQQPAISATTPLLFNTNTNSPVAGGFIVQGDVAQLKNRSTGTLPVGAAGGSKSRFCLIATSGVSWHPVPAQLPIAVIRQPAVPSSAAGGDQQFFQISFTPATAAYPAVSQSVVLVAPAVGTQNLPVLAAGSHTVVPGSHAWMEVTSFPPVIVKPQSAVSDLANSRNSPSCSVSVSNAHAAIYDSTFDASETNELPLDVLESLTELAREQPLENSLTNAKSNDAVIVVSAGNSGVLPSPDVLNSLDTIHSWLQQSEKQTVTASKEPTSVSFTHTSILSSAGLADPQSQQLSLSTSSSQSAAVNVSTIKQEKFTIDGCSLACQTPSGCYQSTAYPAGTLSTMKVKELCRRQLLAKTSAASEKVMAVNQPPSCSSGLLATSPATPSFSAVVSPQASPAYIAPSPSAISLQQRSPSVAADEQVRRSVVESSWPMDTVSTRPSPLIWHMPTASSVNSVSGVNINRSPRPASNSADSSDGTTSQQFTMPRTSILQQLLSD